MAFEIAIVLWDGVEELDFAGPYEILTQWGRDSEREIRVRTVADARQIQCSHGLRIVVDALWDEVQELDLVVLPGGDTRPLQADERFLERLRGFAERETLMASVCTGALVFAKAGLLEGRRATTHWAAIDRLRAYGSVLVDADARFVDEGQVVTSAGVSAGIDMALHLVARLESPERARGIKRYIQYDPQPPV